MKLQIRTEICIRVFLYVPSLLVLFFLLSGCNHRKPVVPPVPVPQFRFIVDTLYPTSPVANQGRTSNCWAYSMASFIETENVLRSLPDDTLQLQFQLLSPEYMVRQKFQAQFDLSLRSGKMKITSGALGHTALDIFRHQGVIPVEVFTENHISSPNYIKVSRRLRLLAHTAAWLPATKNRVRRSGQYLLDEEFGILPDTFSYQGKQYTSQTFAASLPALSQEYVELTSFCNYPYYTSCHLALPDNWERAPFYNLPLDSLLTVMRNALQSGYTLVWDGDVSEPTFSSRGGVAWLPPGTPLDEATRLDAFLRGETSDDHMMHFVGLAHNVSGARFFIAKNSVGPIGPYKGYVYLSEEYIRLKTISVVVNKKCVEGYPDIIP